MTVGWIDHLYVATPEFEATVRFYCDLGFVQSDEWSDDGHRACELIAGSAKIVVAEEDEPIVTVHFGTDTIEPLWDRIRTEQWVVQPLEETHWGTTWLRVRSPDGVVFSVEQSEGK